MRPATHLLTPFTGIALLGAAIAIAAWPQEKTNDSAISCARQVHVTEVLQTDQQRTVRFSGIARAADRARLAFTVPGRLASRSVETGDPVRRGQVVATLDAHEYHLAEAAAISAVAELEVRLTQSERDQARVQRLADARAATTEEVEQVNTATGALRAGVDAARVRLAEARRLVAESTLIAPFSATVTSVNLQAGEWASPGAPVVEISGGSNLEVEIEVPERVVTRLAVAQDVIVELPQANTTTRGRLTSRAHATVGPGALFPVVVSLEAHSSLIPGSAVEVLLEVREQAGLAVPLDAVLNPGSSTPSVFRVRDGRAEQVAVDLGRLDGDRVAVVADLEPGDRVVVAGHTALSTGDSVEVR